MQFEQFIFLKSKTSDHNDAVKNDTESFLNELDYQNIRFLGKIFFIESGGTEEIFKSIYKNYKEPYYFIATNANNSLPASLEIASFLKQQNLSYFIFHGKPSEVRNQIINFDPKYLSFNYSFKDNNILKGEKYGVIGRPSDWLIASNVNYSLAMNKLKISFVDISFDEFKSLLDEIPERESSYELLSNETISPFEIRKALKIYDAIKVLVLKYHLNGITIRCFDLLDTYKSTSCLALAILNSEGITSSCEGDIPSLISMRIIQKLFDKPSFQANPSYIDKEHNYLYLAHCTVPLNMVKDYKLDTHFESGIGVGIKGELPINKDVTIFKVDSSLLKCSIYSGKIEENLHKSNLCRTQIKVRLNERVEELLSSPCGNHLLVFFGDYKDKLIKLIG